jgi:hypothetical protein
MAQRCACPHNKLDKVNLPCCSLETSHHKLIQVMMLEFGGRPVHFFTGLKLARGDVDVKALERRRYLE